MKTPVFIVLLVIAALLGVVCNAQSLQSLVNTKEAALQSLVARAESSQFNRCNIMKSYAGDVSSCSIPACGNTFASTKGFGCNANFGKDAALCGSSCPGMTRSLTQSVVRLAKGSDLTSSNGELAAFIAMSKGLDTEFKTIEAEGKLKAWQYMGSYTGGARIYPGAPQGRSGGSCSDYDPRLRPWYVAAAGGPKDIILVMDTSGSMQNNNGNSGQTRMLAMTTAVEALIDTMTYNDFIGVVQFNTEAANVPSTQTTLLQGRSENLNTLKKQVSYLSPGGQTYMNLGFTKAFDMLSSANERTSKCTRIIIFLTDGEPSTGTESLIHPAIEAGQAKLGTNKARIFTYSMGSASDDYYPRQIACRNNGVWAKIADGEDPLKQMSQYYQFLAAGLASKTVRWTVPYIDAFGMGEMVTGALAVYDRSKSIPLLVGVVGTDVTMEELKTFSDATAIITELILRGETCQALNTSQCQMQHLREATGFVCPSNNAANYGTHTDIATCNANSEIVTLTKCGSVTGGVNNVLCESLNSYSGTPTGAKTDAEVTCCAGNAQCGVATTPTPGNTPNAGTTPSPNGGTISGAEQLSGIALLFATALLALYVF